MMTQEYHGSERVMVVSVSHEYEKQDTGILTVSAPAK